MFSYLITFHMNSGLSYRTTLIGKDLDDIKEKLYIALKKEDGFFHFGMKDNKNITFTVLYENISCIEYELLSEEGILEFESFIQLKDDTLHTILKNVKNDYVLGISLIHSDNELIEKVLSCLPEERKNVIKGIIKLELGKIKMKDVLSAQNEMVSLVNDLYQKNEINIEYKEK